MQDWDLIFGFWLKKQGNRHRLTIYNIEKMFKCKHYAEKLPVLYRSTHNLEVYDHSEFLFYLPGVTKRVLIFSK